MCSIFSIRNFNKVNITANYSDICSLRMTGNWYPVGWCIAGKAYMQFVLSCIDGQGQVVDPQPVTVGIRVGESPCLQDLVIGKVDACR